MVAGKRVKLPLRSPKKHDQHQQSFSIFSRRLHYHVGEIKQKIKLGLIYPLEVLPFHPKYSRLQVSEVHQIYILISENLDFIKSKFNKTGLHNFIAVPHKAEIRCKCRMVVWDRTI
jgi:hypothetical protein